MSSLTSRSTSNNQKFKQQLNNDLKQQQYIAQIAKLSCEVTRFVITKGISNYKIYLKRTPKSKYEYNHERVRNFITQRQSKYYHIIVILPSYFSFYPSLIIPLYIIIPFLSLILYLYYIGYSTKQQQIDNTTASIDNNNPLDDVVVNLELQGKATYESFQKDPKYFIRNYKYNVVQDSFKKIQFNSIFAQRIDVIDLNDLLIGK